MGNLAARTMPQAAENFVNGQVQENDVSKSRTTPPEESKAPILKDVLPSRSRWADIEVEDTFDEELYESDTGRGQNSVNSVRSARALATAALAQK
ncbi:unnamed protein product [Symbiodinium natans]|uniref:Uncharacterized protein n=1 Tax=Symbiodinium natans TaxID=878477 RepID=A0A812NMJ2_9DINO|nr:unnamed protein product [Symbiodinium natans]